MPRKANWSTIRQRLPPVHAALTSERATITLTNGSRLPIGFSGAMDFAAVLLGAVLAATVFAEVLVTGFLLAEAVVASFVDGFVADFIGAVVAFAVLVFAVLVFAVEVVVAAALGPVLFAAVAGAF